MGGSWYPFPGGFQEFSRRAKGNKTNAFWESPAKKNKARPKGKGPFSKRRSSKIRRSFTFPKMLKVS